MKVKYFCEKCGNGYETAEAAQWCEDSHGEAIEAHAIPGKAYRSGMITPDVIYVKFCNKNDVEAAARYQFAGYEDEDFDKVKRKYEKYPLVKF